MFGLLGTLAGYRVRRLPLSPLSPAAVEELRQRNRWAGSDLHAVTRRKPVLRHRDAGRAQVGRGAGDRRRSRSSPESAGSARAAVGPWNSSAWCRELVEFELAESLLGDDLGSLDEAEERGVVEVRADGIAFRHELARRAVQRSVPDCGDAICTGLSPVR